MRTPIFELQDLLLAFHKKKVLTKEELLRATGSSAMTVWRLLRRHGYHTSYNDNARHYTLAGVPQFDPRGLWSFGRYRFSKWGSLTRTVVGVIAESSAGMTADQLSRLLGVKNIKPLLTRLTQGKFLTRERIEGRFVYFTLRKNPQRRQRRQRVQETQEVRAARVLPPLEDIIALLVEIIQRPSDTPRQWARRLARRGVRLRTVDIDAILDHYGVDLKKGL